MRKLKIFKNNTISWFWHIQLLNFENPVQLRANRKVIARLKTELRSRAINEASAKAEA